MGKTSTFTGSKRWRNKAPVIITKQEILAAFTDLLRYYEHQEETSNIKIVKSEIKHILEVCEND